MTVPFRRFRGRPPSGEGPRSAALPVAVSRFAMIGTVLLLAVLGTALVLLGLRDESRGPVPPITSDPSPAIVETTASAPEKTTTKAAFAMSRSVPVRIDIPRIKVHSRVTDLGLESNGTIELPPLKPRGPVGWYRYLATPGEIGPAVMLGHVDTRTGPAVFYRLAELRPGDRVSVTRADGTVARFTIRTVAQVSKSSFPTDRVYGPTRSAELRLITCGGRYDHRRGEYLANVIAYATLV